MEMAQEELERRWSGVVFPEVLKLVTSHLSQREVCALLCVSTACRNLLSAYSPLWKALDLRGIKNPGERLQELKTLERYQNVEELNLEFAQTLEDSHLKNLPFKDLRRLNLNACQKVSGDGIKLVALSFFRLEEISLYWNLKVTDRAVETLLTYCQGLTNLNLSGCKNITDSSLGCIAKHRKSMKKLNLTRCVKLTDGGLLQLLGSCQKLVELYLYAIPSLTDNSFTRLSTLQDLRMLDLCGAQHLTDRGLQAVAKCRSLVSLNLTWCVRTTDTGMFALADNSLSLELLSLHGLLGVTDDALTRLSRSCAQSLTTLDVNGCTNIKRRSRHDLLLLFPRLTTFNVHS